MLNEILTFQGVDELDALGPLEVLRHAHMAGAPFTTRIITLTGQSEVRGSHGLTFKTDGLLASTGNPDVLIVAGGGWNARSEEGAWGEAKRADIPKAIRRMYAEGSILATVCTGAMLVAAAGLAEGRNLITHHQAIDELRAAGATIIEARVVDDGDIVRAGGVTSGLDLALHLVERFAGAEVTTKISSDLEYERRGTVWTRANQTAAAAETR